MAKDPIPESFTQNIRKFIDETGIYNFKTLALIGERNNHVLTRESLTGFRYIGGSVIERAYLVPDKTMDDD